MNWFCFKGLAGPRRVFLTGPKAKGIKVETFRIDYLTRAPKVEKLSLQPISRRVVENSSRGQLFRERLTFMALLRSSIGVSYGCTMRALAGSPVYYGGANN